LRVTTDKTTKNSLLLLKSILLTHWRSMREI